MLQITRFSVENLTQGCVTDRKSPRFSFALDSDRKNVTLKKAMLSLNGWQTETAEQAAVFYQGAALKPFTAYTARLTAEDDAGETARAEVSFETGRLDTPWQAQWISDAAYQFTEKGVSPIPMVFRKALSAKVTGKKLMGHWLDVSVSIDMKEA